MITVATWNMKQAVAPKKPLPELWDWIENVINPDVIVLTEARVPKEGLPESWQAIWTPGGIGPRRTWGTIIAARNIDIRPSEFARNIGNDRTTNHHNPEHSTLLTSSLTKKCGQQSLGLTASCLNQRMDGMHS